MKLKINGEISEYSESALPHLAALMQSRNAPERGVAVALNGQVVSRAQWPQTQLKEGDDIEIIRAVQGG